MPSAKKNKENKKHIEKMKKEIKAQFAAIHRADRNEEIEAHNGKPYTSRNTPTPKTKYNRKRDKRVGRGDYE